MTSYKKYKELPEITSKLSIGDFKLLYSTLSRYGKTKLMLLFIVNLFYKIYDNLNIILWDELLEYSVVNKVFLKKKNETQQNFSSDDIRRTGQTIGVKGV